MSAIITVQGTVDEVIEVAETLKAGKIRQARLAAKAKKVRPGSPAVWKELELGNKLGAIKQHREDTGCSLKEAKDFVEALPGVSELIAEARRPRMTLTS